jgi:predicted RecA/RadA family phage recombinase
MPFEAQFLHGEPLMVDHTPGSAVSAGEVVVVGDRPLIAHLDIAANALGALAAGGGVYKVTAGEAIAVGKKVWWDTAANKVVESGAHKHFGVSVTAAAADGDAINVQHAPDGTTGS